MVEESTDLKLIKLKYWMAISRFLSFQMGYTLRFAALILGKISILFLLFTFSDTPSSPTSSIPNGRGTPRTPTGGSTNDSYDSQVNFLNSIIVDLHAKNSELEQRLRAAISNPGGDRTR